MNGNRFIKFIDTMKILFLSHPITIEPDHEESFGAYPPLGLGYMAAMLEKKGHEVKIIDCFSA